jgi:hypothetical protein
MPEEEQQRAHELRQFIDQVSTEIDAEYERIVARTTEDPRTAGDDGEENWAAVLLAWLPATYHIVTKGRLISTSGETSPQIDILVLYPGYPPRASGQETLSRCGCRARVRMQTNAAAGTYMRGGGNVRAVARVLSRANRESIPGVCHTADVWTAFTLSRLEGRRCDAD